MNFERIPAPFPGMKLWGAAIGLHSFCISYDEKHENLGYSASRKEHHECSEPCETCGLTHWIGEKFTSLGAAKKACEAELKRIMQ